MPELRPNSHPIVESLRKTQRSGEKSNIIAPRGKDNYWFLDREELLKTHPEIENEYIGAGSECIILKTPGNHKKEKVVAFTYNLTREVNAKEAKTTFYLQRIFAILFPNNFPHFYASFAADKDKNLTSSRIRELIEEDKTRKRGENVIFPFDKVKEFADSVHLYGIYDLNYYNIVDAPDGGEYFVDKLRLKKNVVDSNTIEATLKFMREGKYSENQIHAVKVCMDRIIELSK